MSKSSLDDILGAPDPLGILEDSNAGKPANGDDGRVRSGFEEINLFIDERGRPPSQSDTADFREKGLARRLDAIRINPSLLAALKPDDRHGILIVSEAETSTPLPQTLDEVLDILDAEEGFGEGSIFDLKHVTAASSDEDVDNADFVARRKPCPDFEKFRPLFEKANKELELGVRKTLPFKIEKEIAQGQFFVLKGLLAYVAEVGETFYKNGKENARIRTIFSNGTEINNLRRSLAKELYRYGSGRRVTDPAPGILFGGEPETTDVGTGTIYVLRSCSLDPEISKHKGILHKIGVTSAPVERRIANAENESTYLLAPVEIVATYELYNINSTKLENLLHRYFDAARAEVSIQDRFGKPVQPREWFFITVKAIRDAVTHLRDGTLPKTKYDPSTGTIIQL